MRLCRLVTRLRAPAGCPWDRRQTPQSMVPYLIEETHELAEAIVSGSAQAVCEELGDVLFHLVFIAALYQEQGDFDLARALAGIEAKMVRRHPHVFGDVTVNSTEEVKRRWEEIKKEEKSQPDHPSILDSIPSGLPGLLRAYRVSSRAAGAGFDWEDLSGVMAKAVEEWGEFKRELDFPPKRAAEPGPPPAFFREEGESATPAAALELGDLLFTLVNVGRWARIHPETALTAATLKFERRFRHMEQALTRGGQALEQLPREELERAWEAAKAHLDPAPKSE